MYKSDMKPRVTPYAFFVQTCHDEHKKKHPDATVKYNEFAKKCSERWKAMNVDEKQYFKDMSQEMKGTQNFDSRNGGRTSGKVGNRRRSKKQIDDDTSAACDVLDGYDEYLQHGIPDSLLEGLGFAELSSLNAETADAETENNCETTEENDDYWDGLDYYATDPTLGITGGSGNFSSEVPDDNELSAQTGYFGADQKDVSNAFQRLQNTVQSEIASVTPPALGENGDLYNAVSSYVANCLATGSTGGQSAESLLSALSFAQLTQTGAGVGASNVLPGKTPITPETSESKAAHRPVKASAATKSPTTTSASSAVGKTGGNSSTYCTVCDVILNSTSQSVRHYAGKSHNDKVQQAAQAKQTTPQTAGKRKRKYVAESCSASSSSLSRDSVLDLTEENSSTGQVPVSVPSSRRFSAVSGGASASTAASAAKSTYGSAQAAYTASESVTSRLQTVPGSKIVIRGNVIYEHLPTGEVIASIRKDGDDVDDNLLASGEASSKVGGENAKAKQAPATFYKTGHSSANELSSGGKRRRQDGNECPIDESNVTTMLELMIESTQRISTELTLFRKQLQQRPRPAASERQKFNGEVATRLRDAWLSYRRRVEMCEKMRGRLPRSAGRLLKAYDGVCVIDDDDDDEENEIDFDNPFKDQRNVDDENGFTEDVIELSDDDAADDDGPNSMATLSKRPQTRRGRPPRKASAKHQKRTLVDSSTQQQEVDSIDGRLVDEADLVDESQGSSSKSMSAVAGVEQAPSLSGDSESSQQQFADDIGSEMQMECEDVTVGVEDELQDCEDSDMECAVRDGDAVRGETESSAGDGSVQSCANLDGLENKESCVSGDSADVDHGSDCDDVNEQDERTLMSDDREHHEHSLADNTDDIENTPDDRCTAPSDRVQTSDVFGDAVVDTIGLDTGLSNSDAQEVETLDPSSDKLFKTSEGFDENPSNLPDIYAEKCLDAFSDIGAEAVSERAASTDDGASSDIDTGADSAAMTDTNGIADSCTVEQVSRTEQDDHMVDDTAGHGASSDGETQKVSADENDRLANMSQSNGVAVTS